MNIIRQITGLIFDVDGLILNTEALFDDLIRDYMTKVTGLRPSDQHLQQLRSKMYGRRKEDSARLLMRDLAITADGALDEYLAWRQTKLDQLLPSAELLPGAERLIRYADANNIPQALATSSTRHDFDRKTTNHQELFALFGNHVVTADDASQGKPDPEIFLLACTSLELPPAQCLGFEDAPSGLAALKAAKMAAVVVPHPNLNPSLVRQADQVLSSLEDFDPLSWGLPPFT